MKKLFVFIFLFTEAVCIYAQVTKFELVFGGDGNDYARSVIQTLDNGYAITGSSTSSVSGSTDIFLLKLREDGSWEWNKYYGGSNVDWGYSVKQTPDSGYIISGYTNSYGNGGYDAYLVRTDQNGEILWTKTVGGMDWDFSYSLEITHDNGFIISGSTFQNGLENMFLVRLDSLGNIAWQKSYNGNEGGIFHCVRQCMDSGFIAVGEIQFAGNKNILLMKVNAVGDSLWSHSFGSSFEDVGYFVEQTFDTGYVLSGKFINQVSGYYQIAVIKTDSLGNLMFQQAIDGDSANDVSNCVHQYSDSGYIVSG
ncbi:MAG: hypothetical protein JJE25_11045, partial [Bacteroidia bacterium]|nr:hypothetical protein [Bacteroidia bacterium]